MSPKKPMKKMFPRPAAKPAAPAASGAPAASATPGVPGAPPVDVFVPKKGNQPIQSVRGMRDLLPGDQHYWRRVSLAADDVATSYGFERIETPLVEETSLFMRGVGRSTDIVEKELYSWETPGGEHVSLRPEGTAPVVRA